MYGRSRRNPLIAAGWNFKACKAVGQQIGECSLGLADLTGAVFGRGPNGAAKKVHILRQT
jgi:hypothetical protein